MVPVPMWRVSDASALHWREWDGEFVVYHQTSGDTHRLNPLSARALQLLTVEEMSSEAVTARLLTDGQAPASAPQDQGGPETVVDLLNRLAELGLIEAR